MSLKFYIKALLYILVFHGVSSAQNTRFEVLDIEDGLSQGMIYDLCQTRDGFLWIATKDGLNRYDGYNFKVFTNDPFNPFSMAENTVTALFEDSRGWLWVGLESKGLDVFDPRTGRFHHFLLSFGDNKVFGGSNIIRVRETRDGAIWAIKSGGSLLHLAIPPEWSGGLPGQPSLQPLTEVKEVPLQGPGDDNTKPAGLVDLSLRSNGEMLVTSNLGQYLVEPKTLAFRRIHENLLEHTLTRSAAGDEASGGDLWLLRDNEQRQANELRRIRNGQVKIFPFPNSTVKSPRLTAGKNGSVWFSMNKDLWNLAPGEDIDFSKPDLTLDEISNCLTYDQAGNLWIGTNGYGMRKISPVQAFFHEGAAGTSVRGLWANGARYFIKSFFDIRQYDPKTDKISGTPAFPDAPERQSNIIFEPSGALWLLCTESEYTTGMLRRYSPGNINLAEKVYEFDASLNLFDPMLRTGDGKIWMVVNKGRLVRFDPATERFDYFDFGYLFGEKINAVRALSLAQDGNGAFWVGTQMGLVKGTPKKSGNNAGRVVDPAGVQGFDFQLFQASADNRKGLNNNVVTCLLPDPGEPGKTLWIGTKGGGINRMDIRTGECRHITTDDGLLNNVVYGILPAGQPKLGGNFKLPPNLDGSEFWCSTNRGLAKLVQRPDGKFVITTFTAALGLQDNEFNTYAFCKADNGELLFGGVNGLNRFFPEQLNMDTMPPPVFVVGLEINHKKAGFGSPGSPLTQPIETLRELRLSHDQNNISFEFAALDLTDPSKNRYRYRLVGLDNDWVETGNLRFAHFNHLAPGRYEFRVQGNNGESAWADAQPIIVVVMPPWWRSKLAYSCYFLLLAWVGWRAYKFQIQRVKEREQLAYEHRETERVKALEQVKTNFFSNVTHEFRTPLTLIIEPLRQLLKNPNDTERNEKIRLAEKNSRRLLALVNQLLDMAKLESGSMALDLRLADFSQTVRGVFETFLPLAQKRGIKLTLADPPKGSIPPFEFDPVKVELVLNNLISNALKFTPEGGQVKLEIKAVTPFEKVSPLAISHPPLTDSNFSISVTDTGIGIPAGELDKIFDRFYQVNGSHTRAGEGTGIGLALSKELVELMGGGISVESEVGKGSTFTFWLPVRANGNWEIGNPGELKAVTPYEKVSPLAEGEYPVVLVVEDNTELRTFIKKSIGETWQVAEASNGEEGVKKAIELLPDLVISDVMMPVKDGYALCDELKTHELTAHVPIILLTAKSALDSKLKGLRTGADDYLTKPFNTEELLARMENLVVLRRKLRERYGHRPVAMGGEQPDENLSPPDREFLRKFNLLLEQHLQDETLGVEDFAKKMFISRVQLHRKLKAITGRSATDFIRDYRLERAHAMLRNREGMVGEIAMWVGFSNEKYFSTVFKEKYGVPPSQVA